MNFLKFLQYNNAVPIAISIMLLGAGGTFAATNPDAILASKQTVISDDNSYLLSKDLSAYTPVAQIVNVTEDADFYYVAYKVSTIDISDHVWRDVSRDETMRISKTILGPDADLGLYVADQLAQSVDHEKSRLVDTQKNQSGHQSSKIVATAYTGIVGKFLDSKSETLPGYSPVKPPPPKPVPGKPAEVVFQDPTVSNPSPGPLTEAQVRDLVRQQVQELLAQNSTSATTTASTVPPSPSGGGADTQPPVIAINGNNPAQIDVGTSYADLGATVTDNVDNNLGIKASVDGGAQIDIGSITIDTSVAGTHTIIYSATDNAGNTGTATRTVDVAAPQQPTPLPQQDATTTADTPAQSTQQTQDTSTQGTSPLPQDPGSASTATSTP